MQFVKHLYCYYIKSTKEEILNEIGINLKNKIKTKLHMTKM